MSATKKAKETKKTKKAEAPTPIEDAKKTVRKKKVAPTIVIDNSDPQAIIDAIKKHDMKRFMPETPEEIEGDRSTWHARLFARDTTTGMEAWRLFNGEQAESSPFDKTHVLKMRDEELAKLSAKTLRPTDTVVPPPTAPGLLDTIDLGHGKKLKFQRRPATTEIRAVIVDADGDILFRGPIMPETPAGISKTRMDVCAQMQASTKTYAAPDYNNDYDEEEDDDYDEDEE